MAPALKDSNSPNALTKPFCTKERQWRGGVSLANSMVPEPVFLRTGKNAHVNLYQRNVILCPDKKGPCAKAQLSSSEVPVLTRKR